VDRPKVVVYGVASVDGRLTLAPDVLLLVGDERWEAVAGSSDVYAWLKATHKPQSFLEGSNSLVLPGTEPEPLPPVVGDPQPLYEDYVPDALVMRLGHQGWFTVVDGRGRVRWMYKEWPAEEWAGWHVLVLVSRATPAEYLAYLQREGIPYLVAGEGPVDLHQALEKLQSRLGVTSVLSTSPGKLGGALLRAGLVDEIDLEFFPAIIGGRRTPTLFESPSLQPDQWPVRLELLSAQVVADGRVWLRYQVSGAEPRDEPSS
jgi:2,5-diamino-6-(ribosylamino)-4(3H)-pyrimidinone 5'-phosphate reductase